MKDLCFLTVYSFPRRYVIVTVDSFGSLIVCQFRRLCLVFRSLLLIVSSFHRLYILLNLRLIAFVTLCSFSGLHFWTWFHYSLGRRPSVVVSCVVRPLGLPSSREVTTRGRTQLFKHIYHTRRDLNLYTLSSPWTSTPQPSRTTAATHPPTRKDFISSSADSIFTPTCLWKKKRQRSRKKNHAW